MAQTEHITSTGHDLSAGGYLDLHFDANRDGYEELVRMAGFEHGWHVLDAGCGSGSFLPALAREVCETGALTALDFAPENVALVQQRLDSWKLDIPISAIQGSIFDLPFQDDTFDGVWCANVSQYLSDDELRAALSEFARTTRPGGLIVIKEYDPKISTVQPSPTGVFERRLETADTDQARGVIRAWNLRRFLADAGLHDVRQRSILIEHRAPLSDLEMSLEREYLTWTATTALNFDLVENDLRFWEKQIDQSAHDALANHPDYYRAEGQTLASGRVPENGR